MYNYCIIIGRIAKDFDAKEYKKGNYTKITLAVNRPYKNNETDTYDVDFLTITLWDNLCDIACNYLEKGSTVCVKGRLQAKPIELANGIKINTPEIIAERLIFVAPPQEKNH